MKNLFVNIEKWSNVKKVLFVPVLLVLLCLVGYIMLVMVYFIPTDAMKSKMQASSNIFLKEGSYTHLTGNQVEQLDNYTDSLMLLTASNPRNENIWKSAVHTSHYVADGYDPCQTLLYLYTENDIDKDVRNETYSRYWHGYLVILKPLLYFCSYPSIRYIMMFVQIALFTLLVVKLADKNKTLIIPVLLTWIFLNPAVTMMSLQYNSVFIVTFVSMIIIAYKSEKWQDKPLYIWGILFLVTGALTSYLDLLTYPLITLGIPATLWFSFNYSASIKENLKKIIFISGFWTTGYSVMWGSKWLLGSIITGENILREASDAIQFRTSSNLYEQSFNFSDVILNQFKSSYSIIWIVLIIAVLFAIITGTKKQMLNIFVPCIFIAVYPLVWYAVLKNHSFIHSFFTYRELAITLYAGITFIVIYRAKERNS